VLAFTFVSSFEQPAREAMLPLLVPREIFPTAVTVNSALVQLSIAVGPAVAGLMIAASGVGSAYAIYVLLVVGSTVALVFLKVQQKAGERRAVSLAAVKEGVKFVWKNPVLLGAMSLDMFSVIFAGAQALLPIYAEEILHVGPTGYGLLTSSQAIGAFLTSVTLTLLPPIKQSGRALLIGVACFGIATIVFGVSRSFPLSLVVYAFSGVADQINVVMRRTIIQLASPDHLRGRVSSIGGLFVGASNHLGMLESGLIAAVTSATFSVVSGGIGCLVVVATIAARMPELRRYRIDRHAF
jgi:MFS family permease